MLAAVNCTSRKRTNSFDGFSLHVDCLESGDCYIITFVWTQSSGTARHCAFTSWRSPNSREATCLVEFARGADRNSKLPSREQTLGRIERFAASASSQLVTVDCDVDPARVKNK